MSKQTDLLKSITTMQSGERQPVMQVIKSNPGLAAMLSKLRDDGVQPRYGQQGNRELIAPNNTAFRQQSERTMDDLKDSEGVQQLLPDIELSAQILISSILSPKDMVTVEPIYSAPEGILPSQTSTEIIDAIRKHFEQTYKIKNDLNNILRDVLFDKGAHIRMVLPENSLDEFVNRHTPYGLSMESLGQTYNTVFDATGHPRSLGILGDGISKKAAVNDRAFKFEDFASDVDTTVDGRIALEAYDNFTVKEGADGYKQIIPDGTKRIEQDDLLYVTDNVAILSMPRLSQAVQEMRVSQRIQKGVQTRVAMEGATEQAAVNQRFVQSRNIAKRKINDRELSAALFKNPGMKSENISSLKTQQQLDRRTVGNPLVMELPTEAVIPVHVPGQPENHIGYFVLLDNTGHPISIKSRADYYSDLAGRMGTNIGTTSLPSQVIARTKSMMGGFDCSNSEHLNYSARVYQDLIISDLLARLRNGVYTNGVELGKNDDVYRIMFARTLLQQRTQLLFVPVELVTYFAFRYNADGIGRSLLTDMKIINALRSTLMFANMMAAIRNSIGMTTVNFKLDPEDPDPTRSLEVMMNEVIRGRQQAFPLNTASPADIVYQLQRAGYQFTYSDHPGLPDIAVEFGERSSNYPKPDTELEENLRKRMIMGIGLNPESVDTAFSGEFATTVTQNNILLTRRVMQIQDLFTPQLTSHLLKYTRASEPLMDEIYGIVEAAYDSIKIPSEVAEKFNYESDEEIREKVKKSVIIEHLVEAFLKGFEVSLPRPTATTIKNQKEEFDIYDGLLNTALDAWINKEFFTPDLAGKMSETVEGVRASVKAYFIRKWFSANGVMPELSELTALDSEGQPKVNIWHEQKDHVESLLKSLSGLTASLQPIIKATDKVADDVGIQDNSMGGGFGGGGIGGGDTGFGGGGGGGDDLGLGGDDLGLNTTPATGQPGEEQSSGAGGENTAGAGSAADFKLDEEEGGTGGSTPGSEELP